MNRFDRVTSLLLLLQTRSVVTAKFLADHFDVTERTVYRDIRTLENAGVPIGSEAGVGYFLEKGYRLPPVTFTLDESAALLLGEKLLYSSLDQNSYADYQQALNKVRAVLETSDKDYLNSLDADIEVMPTGILMSSALNSPADQEAFKQVESSQNNDRWLRECRTSLVRRQCIEIDYQAGTNSTVSSRCIEPIGLFYYSLHWHLIAWCRLREGYRDFRLDRILKFTPVSEQFPRHSRSTLQQYLEQQHADIELHEVELLFDPDVARFVGVQKYLYGFVSEVRTEEGIKMVFLTATPQYMARWLLQYTNGVQILSGQPIEEDLIRLTAELGRHWSDKSPS